MYKTTTAERKHIIRKSGHITFGKLGDVRRFLDTSFYAEVMYMADSETLCDLRLFSVHVMHTLGMIIFQDLTCLESAMYPPEIMEILCRMAIERIEKYAKETDSDVILITTDIPFLPEIFLERKYDISKYDLTLSGKPGWQGLLDSV